MPLTALLALSALLHGALATAGPLAERLREHRAEARVAAAAAATPTDAAPNATPNATATAALTADPGAALRVQRDEPYGPDPAQRMDIYLPPTGQPVAGVVFMVHGGAWRWGDKAAPAVVDAKVARWVPLGLALVSVNHRLLPGTPVAQQADDIRRALAHAQRLAAQGQWAPERFVLMGHSAGAHLVALVSADPAPALALGARPWLGVVSLDSAALDVPGLMQQRHARLYDNAFGADPLHWQALSPTDRLSPGTVPALLVCSTLRRDDSCGPAQAHAERLHALGQRAEVLPQALSHGDVNAELGRPGAYTDATQAFMASLHPALAQALARGLPR